MSTTSERIAARQAQQAALRQRVAKARATRTAIARVRRPPAIARAFTDVEVTLPSSMNPDAPRPRGTVVEEATTVIERHARPVMTDEEAAALADEAYASAHGLDIGDETEFEDRVTPISNPPSTELVAERLANTHTRKQLVEIAEGMGLSTSYGSKLDLARRIVERRGV